MHRRHYAALVALVGRLATASAGTAANIEVRQNGGDFSSIQAALDVAVAGDDVVVHEGPDPYFEKPTFPRSGSPDAFISLRAAAGEHPVIDGTGVEGPTLVAIEDRSFVRLAGFELRNNLGVSDGSGVRVTGAGQGIEITGNEIHDIRGRNAMGITVYATASQPIRDLVIRDNHVHDCQPAPSEAIVLNGNIDGFVVENNVVRDVNNIGIDFIGGETDIQPNATLVARNGLCRGNTVERARSSYGGGHAAGIYVDGGRDIVIENNLVRESDLGIEIGAENAGQVTRDIVVRNNLLVRNDKAGLVFGGYDEALGRVRECVFRNNTLWRNDALGQGHGQIWVQWATANDIRNNVVVADAGQPLFVSWEGDGANDFDYNLWWTPDGAAEALFVRNGDTLSGFTDWRAATGRDAHSLLVDPLLVAPEAGDFHLAVGSPASNAGDPATAAGSGEVDLDGAPRLSGPRADIGADELTCGDGTVHPGETCDDGGAIDGDGCDSNCTMTACGNGIVTAGETCDDGNTAAGDCCDAACSPEPEGAICNDGDACTPQDGCHAGVCVGSSAPTTGCLAASVNSLLLRDAAGSTRDQITFGWKKGAAVPAGALDGLRAGTSGLTFCLHDRLDTTPRVALRARIPAAPDCGSPTCWRPASSGVRFVAPPAGSSDGIRALRIIPAAAGASSALVQGRGAALDLPTLPLDVGGGLAVRVWSDDGLCLGADLGTATINRPDLVKAR